MARKTRKIQDLSSDDDDAPEAVSHSTSKADAKRNQKALRDFETDEKARRKARNQERDQKLKERARVTKGGKTKTGERPKGVRIVDDALEGEDESESGGDGSRKGAKDDVEARMLRAMRDAADEMESGEGDEDGEFTGLGQEMELGDDMASISDSSFAQDEDDEDAEISVGESDSIDPEAPTDDEDMDEDEEPTSLHAHIHRPERKADYLADDLFAAAFASQNSNPHPKKSEETTTQHTVKKRRRKFNAHPKDLVLGYVMSSQMQIAWLIPVSGRTIRTLPQLSNPRSQATARSVPSAGARKFVDQSLAMKGKKAFIKAKKKGWERRPANVGVMKYQGAPHGFARSTG
ncbi:hypothetical protein JVT61DRAFT_9226 [Boletus reticuloceps]|uniref:Uncharacterized protein n=1 Tax=Boletus reticuloceps TaxID=495285 RepID=A0A8I3A574_9AGAM|nr:hypothetical protein JVT61DRAFT_9226 [Boletus reticuloceps]